MTRFGHSALAHKWSKAHASTHYDGPATWDEQLAPSCWHGVTTVVMGNCGVGFAPVRANEHQRLIDLTKGVEDIPGTALIEGITWGWESFPQYLDKLDSRRWSSMSAPMSPIRRSATL